MNEMAIWMPPIRAKYMEKKPGIRRFVDELRGDVLPTVNTQLAFNSLAKTIAEPSEYLESVRISRSNTLSIHFQSVEQVNWQTVPRHEFSTYSATPVFPLSVWLILISMLFDCRPQKFQESQFD